jgi:hypothetical protein
MGCLVWGSNLCRGPKFFCSVKCADWHWDPSSIPFNGYWGSFLGVKQSGCVFSHSLLYSAMGKNNQIYTCIVSWCGQGTSYHSCDIWVNRLVFINLSTFTETSASVSDTRALFSMWHQLGVTHITWAKKYLLLRTQTVQCALLFTY